MKHTLLQVRKHLILITTCAVLWPVGVSYAQTRTGTPQVLPADTRFSASLRGEPLQQLLTLIGHTTQTRFRYGAPVDTLVTETFDNAPLWPTLEALLLKSGFHMWRSQDAVFIFRNQALPPLAAPSSATRAKVGSFVKGAPVRVLPSPAVSRTVAPAAWQYWVKATPPPEEWTMPPPSNRILTEPVANTAAGWRNADLAITATKRPGVTLRLPSKVTSRFLRWPMKLREIPLGAQLLVETSADATFYVNGAPMFRRRSGRQLLDLSQVLRIGDNCLALQWEPPAKSDTSHSEQESAPAPTLHFEWFFSERNP